MATELNEMDVQITGKEEMGETMRVDVPSKNLKRTSKDIGTAGQEMAHFWITKVILFCPSQSLTVPSSRDMLNQLSEGSIPHLP